MSNLKFIIQFLSSLIHSFIPLQILFLNCGDLKNALLTGAKMTNAYKELNIHMSSYSILQGARDVFTAYILLSDNFHPGNPTDFNYLWDVWYSLQWTEQTRTRFVEDIKKLSESIDQLWISSKVNIPNQKDVQNLKHIFKKWLHTASNFPPKILKNLIRNG